MSKYRKVIPGISIIFLLISLLSLATSCVAGTTSPDAGGTGGFDWTLIVFLVVIFGLMYLLMIRPQRRRQKEQQKMMQELNRGDEIVTTSGIYGVIDRVEETSFVIRLESGATMRVVKGAVAGRRPTT